MTESRNIRFGTNANEPRPPIVDPNDKVDGVHSGAKPAPAPVSRPTPVTPPPSDKKK